MKKTKKKLNKTEGLCVVIYLKKRNEKNYE